MPLQLYLIRHGETEWSQSGQHTGRADIPLNHHGADEARQLGHRLCSITFSKVLSSPLQRARQTCELAGLSKQAEIEFDLVEWDNGDFEGKTRADVLTQHSSWNLFRDGCPNGEMPTDISARADRMIDKLRNLEGNIALFTHGHFGRVLAMRWIGLSVSFAQHFLLNTASVSILCYEHDRTDRPVINLWNSAASEMFTLASSRPAHSRRVLAIDRWEKEGGEIPSA